MTRDDDSVSGGGGLTRRDILALGAFGLVAGVPRSGFAAEPQGQLTWGVHISLAPTWFDPAETPGLITPFMVLYALHDAIVKPMPGQPLAPCLAESVTASEDGLSYDFVLRQNATFHNGDPVTAECRRKIEMSPVAQSRDDILLAADATTQSTFRIPSVPRAGLLTPPFLGPFL